MIRKEIVERIEGEARVDYEIEEDKIAFAQISFPHFRGMERILEGAPAHDALMITPRICGICGHAHLMAAVRAIESAYAAAGSPIFITPKAHALREITLYLELVQNHIKWFYLTVIPALQPLCTETLPKTSGAFAPVALSNRILALFAGQAPHSAYAIPGGVTCDPSELEQNQALGMLEELEKLLVSDLLGTNIAAYMEIQNLEALTALSGDFSYIINEMEKNGLQGIGQSHDRFLVLGEHTLVSPAKITHTTLRMVDNDKVSEDDTNTFAKGGFTYGKNALYKGMFFETGPMARAMARLDPLIKNIHRRHKDALITRIAARVHETVLLITEIRRLLRSLDLEQESFRAPMPISRLSAEGVGIVEAPRGPLIHRVKLKSGIIERYDIITPTQWNLAHGTRENPGPAQRALMGANPHHSDIIFRSFDVCSVCTTH